MMPSKTLQRPREVGPQLLAYLFIVLGLVMLELRPLERDILDGLQSSDVPLYQSAPGNNGR